MMRDLHVHSTFSDGKNTPEEIAEEAFRLHMDTLGFSEHSYTGIDGDEGTLPETYDAYKKEICRLKELYRGKMEILCGIEQDIDSPIPATGFDYVIGSVHYLKKAGRWIFVDYSPQDTREAVEHLYDGDPYAYAEHYFARVQDLADTQCDIIGHFDLFLKYCEKDPLMDPTHPRVLAAGKKALDVLLKTNRPFEVNTGAISRGWRTSPYPGKAFREYILKNGGKLILSSDSHKKETLMFQFDKWRQVL